MAHRKAVRDADQIWKAFDDLKERVKIIERENGELKKLLGTTLGRF